MFTCVLKSLPLLAITALAAIGIAQPSNPGSDAEPEATDGGALCCTSQNGVCKGVGCNPVTCCSCTQCS
jgi:hypothetical protein